jgi:hypothetical protein
MTITPSLIIALIITIVLTTLIIYAFFKKTNSLITKKDSVSILVTLLTTFLGVYLAIYLTHDDIIKKEKSDIIKVLEVAIREIQQAETELKAYEQYNDSAKYLIFLKNNKPRNIEIANQISKSELFLKYVSRHTFKNLNTGFFTIQNINEWLVDETAASGCKFLITESIRAHEFIIEIIESELKLINGDITEEELVIIQMGSLKKMFKNPSQTDKSLYRLFKKPRD